MYVKAVEVLYRPELDYERFVASSDITSQNPASETHREFLAYFSVVVGEDMFRVGINTYEVVRLYIKAGFFFYFTFDTLRYALSDLHDSARERP